MPSSIDRKVQQLLAKYPSAERRGTFIICTLCNTGTMSPFNTTAAHFEGARHDTEVRRQGRRDLINDLLEDYEDQGLQRANTGSAYCMHCMTGDMAYHSAMAHLDGANHFRTMKYVLEESHSCLTFAFGARTVSCTLCRHARDLSLMDIIDHLESDVHQDAVSDKQEDLSVAHGPHVVRVANKYMCMLCNSSPMNFNETATHVDSFQHMSKIGAQNELNELLKKNRPHLQVDQKGGLLFCQTCPTKPMTVTVAKQHLASDRHQRATRGDLYAAKVALKAQHGISSTRIKAISEPASESAWGMRPANAAMENFNQSVVTPLGKYPLNREYSTIVPGDFPLSEDLRSAKALLNTLTDTNLNAINEKFPFLIQFVKQNSVSKELRIDALEKNVNIIMQIESDEEALRKLYHIAASAEECSARIDLASFNKSVLKMDSTPEIRDEVTRTEAGRSRRIVQKRKTTPSQEDNERAKLGTDVVTASYTLHRIELPGVGENRPPVLRGDRIILGTEHTDPSDEQLWVRSGTEKRDSIGAYIHEVDADSVLISLPYGYHKGSLASVVFRLGRHQERAIYRAIEQCPFSAMLHLQSATKCRNMDAKLKPKEEGAVITKAVLNDSQLAFLEHVEAPTSPWLSVLWGPPGTGKTTTLCATVADLILRDPSARILVCTPGNEAADLVVERLHDNPDIQTILSTNACAMMRVNGLSREVSKVSKTVCRYSPPSVDGMHFHFPTTEILMKNIITVATILTCDRFSSMGLPPGYFTHLLVDEAGHSTEALLLCALSLARDSRKVVLVGDPKQLGPKVTTPALRDINLHESPLLRLMKHGEIWSSCGAKLQHCYRSHPAIVKLVNACYADTLHNARPEDKKWSALWDTKVVKELLHKAGKLLTSKPAQPILFINHSHPESREADSPSWGNTFEVDLVSRFIFEAISKVGLVTGFSDVSVITPYRKQAQKIHDKLVEEFMTNHPDYVLKKDGEDISQGHIPIKVATVDSFQGCENKVIIISCVRTNFDPIIDAKMAVGFVGQTERTNVAVSRAKDLLIMMGNRDSLSNDATWREYFTRLDNMDNGVIIDIGGPEKFEPLPKQHDADVDILAEELGALSLREAQ